MQMNHEKDKSKDQKAENADAPNGGGRRPTRVLLVDDEDRFRKSLAERLSLRGIRVHDVADGEEAVRYARHRRPDVVLLDLNMPGLRGEDVLRQIKQIAPEVQVVILTGHGSVSSATTTGRLDAFAYLEKPCDTDALMETIDKAHREKRHALARRDMVQVESRSVWGWLKGVPNFRPGVLMIAAALFAALYFAPAPDGMLRLLSTPKTGDPTSDPIAGYANYQKMDDGQTVAGYYSSYAKRQVTEKGPDGTKIKRDLTPDEAAQKIRVMVGVLLVAALLWATGALPIGITALLVGVLMYLFGIFTPNQVAGAFAKDAVLFIAGVLAMSAGIAKTGLDRRIGLLLLGTSRSRAAFLFLFLPLLAVSASFLSEHALVAFIAPILMVVYMASVRMANVTKDRSLAVMLILGVTFAANAGGPGSPAAGGRNAVMVGILSDYGVEPTFGQWVQYGLPFVPVMALVIGAYFFLRLRKSIKVKDLNVASIVKQEAKRLGPMTREEYLTAAVLVGVIVLWITSSGTLGMGGPVMLGLVVLAVLRIIGWREINGISWEVVALYAGASAMGKGLATTGAAMWVADVFVNALPPYFQSGEGLCIAVSLFTGILTNIMSDGATVSAIGPVAVPMAQASGTHPWMVGFATAFASSFANMLIIGTPNNAIAYTLAKDPDTGEQLVTLGDFLKHGFVVTLLGFVVLWGWTFFGYWRWIGF
jgi:solute carrier family 13 (sodium-dependent dicarboxylate transporter), member 2/3/5